MSSFQLKVNSFVLSRHYRKLVQFLIWFLRGDLVEQVLFEVTLERLSEERTLVFLELQV